MSLLDIEILYFFNQYAQISTLFDKALLELSTNNLLKGGVIIFCFYYLWFKNCHSSKSRFYILNIFISTTIAMTIARLISIFAPYRPRPIHNEELAFNLPFGIQREMFEGWSSFPSDHATLFISLSIGLFIVSKKVGVFALLYTLVFICFPRVYLGLHYPSDIFAGSLIGLTITLLVYTKLLRGFVYISFYAFYKKYLSLSYGLLFIFTFQVAEMFHCTRKILKALYEFSRSVGLF